MPFVRICVTGDEERPTSEQKKELIAGVTKLVGDARLRYAGKAGKDFQLHRIGAKAAHRAGIVRALAVAKRNGLAGPGTHHMGQVMRVRPRQHGRAVGGIIKLLLCIYGARARHCGALFKAQAACQAAELR